MTTPTTAARLHEPGAPLRVEPVELPEPGPGEVLVRLTYAGVNPIDSYVAAGRVAADGPLPRTLGAEATGEVDGRPVVVAGGGLGSTRDGVWAGAAVVPEDSVLHLPDGVDPRAAAASGIAGLTAWNVVRLAGLTPADTVLVLGAGGGVGLPIVSLAASTGATVWGQVGAAAKADAVREAGAQDVLVTEAEGLAALVGDARPTVVFDPLGGGFPAATLGLLRPRGRYVVFGTSAGTEVTLNWQTLYRNSLTVLGYGGLGLSPEERRAGLRDALAAMADGRLRIRIDRTVPLARVDEAFAALADRSLTGKVVLDVQNSDPA